MKESFEKMDIRGYLSNSPFYTDNDRRFRYVRDVMLGQENYFALMDHMLSKFEYDIDKSSKDLWIDKEIVKTLVNNGHIIGLHSHTHPTRITSVSDEEMEHEYRHNKETLEQIVGFPINVAAYPCGQYDERSIKLLRDIGINIAFNAFLVPPTMGYFQYEIPRQDHSIIMKRIRK